MRKAKIKNNNRKRVQRTGKTFPQEVPLIFKKLDDKWYK